MKLFRVISFVVPVFFLSNCNGWKHTARFNYVEYKCEAYQQELQNRSNYLIVDVRTPAEYRKGHLKDAINISYFGGEYGKYVDTLDKKKPVFIYCETQHRSPLAAKIMRKKGFSEVIDLTGGFIKWEKAKLPIER